MSHVGSVWRDSVSSQEGSFYRRSSISRRSDEQRFGPDGHPESATPARASARFAEEALSSRMESAVGLGSETSGLPRLAGF